MSRPSRSLPLLLSLILPGVALSPAGCIYSSQVDKREFALPKKFNQGKKARPAAGKTGRWWAAFKDPELDRLMRLAFDNNLALEQSRARIEQARQTIKGARAGWMPSINAEGAFGRSKRSFFLGNQKVDIERNNFSLSLAASYEIDVFGKTRYAYKSAKHAYQASEEQLRASYMTLAAQLAEAYYMVVAARAQLKLLEQTIANRQAQLELVERRYKVGVVSAVDLYQALGNLAVAKAQRAVFRGQLRLAEHLVAVLVGKYPGQVKSGALDQLPRDVRELGSGVPSTLLKQRPDLRAAHHALSATDARVGAALAAHFPSFTLSGSLGADSVSGFFNPAAVFWNFVGSVSASLFQGGRIHAEYKRQQAVLREQIAAFKQTLLQAVKEVEDALVSGRSNEERVEHLEKSAEAAEGALRLATEQYAQGLQNYLRVLDTERNMYQARSELISARRELVSARIQLARALGGSWMDREIERQRKMQHDKDR